MQDDSIYRPPTAELEQPETQIDQELASRWSRLGAALLDTLFIMLLFFPLVWFVGIWDILLNESTSLSIDLLLSLGVLITYLILNGYLLATEGQTLGKKLIGIRVVDSETGQILSFAKIFGVRYLPIFICSQIPAIGQIVGLIDSIFIFRKDKRCLHDLIADTRVIKAR